MTRTIAPSISMTRRALLAGGASLSVAAVLSSVDSTAASACPVVATGHPAPTRLHPVAGDAFALVLPPRDAIVSPSRARELAVAFIAPTADAATFDLVQAAGIGRVQVVASWAWITRDGEAAPHWEELDAFVAEATRRGLSITVHMNATPGWVHPDLIGTGSFWDYIWYIPTRTPEELAAWSRFCAQISARYAGKVWGYEVWNEENWRDFSKPVEDSVQYAAMLHAAWVAIKGSDAAAQVIFGGTTRSDPGFLKATYAALDAYSGAAQNRHFFDLMGVHPYTDSLSPDDHEPGKVRENMAGGEFDDNFLGIDRVYAEMVRHGDADKQIYLGEFSYSVDAGAWFVVESDALRAYYLRRAFELTGARPWVNGLAWFTFASGDAWWQSWSLVSNGAPTRSYHELAQLTGVEHGPARVPLQVRALAGGSYRITMRVPGTVQAYLYVDGVQVARGTTADFTWTPAAGLMGTTPFLQAVAITGSDTIDSQIVFLPLGPQRVEAPLTAVKVDRGIDVAVGVDGRRVPVAIEVDDASGHAVLVQPLDKDGHARDSRYELLLKIPTPGTYTVRALGPGRRDIATPVAVTVS